MKKRPSGLFSCLDYGFGGTNVLMASLYEVFPEDFVVSIAMPATGRPLITVPLGNRIKPIFPELNSEALSPLVHPANRANALDEGPRNTIISQRSIAPEDHPECC